MHESRSIKKYKQATKRETLFHCLFFNLTIGVVYEAFCIGKG